MRVSFGYPLPLSTCRHAWRGAGFPTCSPASASVLPACRLGSPDDGLASLAGEVWPRRRRREQSTMRVHSPSFCFFAPRACCPPATDLFPWCRPILSDLPLLSLLSLPSLPSRSAPGKNFVSPYSAAVPLGWDGSSPLPSDG